MLDKIDGVEVRYFINKKWVGTKKDLVKEFNCADRTITRYIKQGMPEHKQSTKEFKIFDMEECLAWKDRNINKEQSKKTKKNSNNEIEDDEENFSDEESSIIWDSLSNKQRHKIAENAAYLRKTIADADKSVSSARREQMKELEEEGLLVDANDIDKTMAEQAILHRTDKTNDEKVLPITLENKTAQEISIILHEHNQDRLDLLDKLVNKKLICSESFYDVAEIVIKKLLKNTPKEIIKCVSDM